MAEKRQGVFVSDAPDTRLPVSSPEAPVTSSEILGAHWTLSRQDFVGADKQAEIDAYSPIVGELGKREPRDGLGFEKSYFGAYRSSDPLNYGLIWADVEKYRAADPNFLKDIPAKNSEEFGAWVRMQELKKRRSSQSVVSRESGAAQGALGFATDIVSGFADPINLGAMIVTGGLAAPVEGAARSVAGNLARNMLREGAINSATEIAELPAISSNRAAFGEEMTVGDMATEVAVAGAAGALFPVAQEALGAVVKKGVKLVADSPVGQAVGQAVKPPTLGTLETATDRDVAAAFSKAVPAEMRTPDEQAAVHVVTRQAQIDDTNPFKTSPVGMDTHADRLANALATLTRAGDPEGRGPLPKPRTPPIPAADLSPDSVIRFVINDLEGGAAVVRYNAADGGTTKYGIAAKHNPGVDVENLTERQAADIAKQKYWFPELDRADPRTAAVAFDAGYISGPKTGKRILRESGGDPARALELYREHLNRLADSNPDKAKYRKGWNKRIDRLEAKISGADNGPRLKPEVFAGEDDLAIAQRYMDDVNAEGPGLAKVGAARDVPPQRNAEVPNDIPGVALTEQARLPDPPLRTEAVSANVAPDSVDETMLSPAFVAPRGEPGFHIEDSHGDGHFLYSVFRDKEGEPKAVVRFPATQEARDFGKDFGQTYGVVTSYVSPDLRRKGIATKLYNLARAEGHDIDRLSGGHDLTPNGASFVSARRSALTKEPAAFPAVERAAEANQPRAADQGASLPPEIAEEQVRSRSPGGVIDREKLFENASSPEVSAQIMSMDHDARIALEADPEMSFRLGDDETPRTLADILADQDADEAAIAAARNCL